MENLGIGCEITQDRMIQVLKELFPSLNFHYWEMEKDEPMPEDAVLFTLLSNRSEFPIKLDLYGFSKEDVAEREQYIAKQLSVRLDCRTIVPYQEKGSSYPYHSVIFDKDRSYLANNNLTLWADDEGGEVKIIEPIQLKEYQFDSEGIMKSSS
jgi:hypothetical protein